MFRRSSCSYSSARAHARIENEIATRASSGRAVCAPHGGAFAILATVEFSWESDLFLLTQRYCTAVVRTARPARDAADDGGRLYAEYVGGNFRTPSSVLVCSAARSAWVPAPLGRR